MKPKHVASQRTNAQCVLKNCGIHIGADYHTLSSDQVDQLLIAADIAKYQKPKDANGSRGRYFHDLMQRRAQAKD